MITVDEKVQLNISYNLEKIGAIDSLLFFDIETTGLSAGNSSLYLIGCLYFDEKAPHFRQWMAESLSDELTCLEDFFQFASQFETLISFNGSTFDINYLESCAKQYNIPSPLSSMNSFDILKEVRHFRKIFGLDSFRQKSIECFLGIHREDQFSGGELIPIYEEFVETKDERLKHFLLLHNREDVLGMTEILPIIHFVDFFKNPELEVIDSHFTKSGKMFFVEGKTLNGVVFPCELQVETSENVKMTLHNSSVYLEIPSINAELKYFYPNYKDYYYLPAEDTAIHKKIASFVDKEHRVQATKENCYQKVSGAFLIAPQNCCLPTFKACYDAPCEYVQYDEKSLCNYLKNLL